MNKNIKSKQLDQWEELLTQHDCILNTQRFDQAYKVIDIRQWPERLKRFPELGEVDTNQKALMVTVRATKDFDFYLLSKDNLVMVFGTHDELVGVMDRGGFLSYLRSFPNSKKHMLNYREKHVAFL